MEGNNKRIYVYRSIWSCSRVSYEKWNCKRIRGTLKNCIRQMEGMDYIQVHKSYFVNMIYIDNIELKHIVLKIKREFR